MRSKELKSYNLPEDRVILGSIDAKPVILLFFLFTLGLLLCAYKVYIWGVCLAVLSLLCSLVLPNRILVQFFYDYLVIYNHASRYDCEIIYYDDVLSWRYISGLSYDTLSVTLVDGSVHNVDGYSRITFEKYMNKFLKDKKAKSKKTR